MNVYIAKNTSDTRVHAYTNGYVDAGEYFRCWEWHIKIVKMKQSMTIGVIEQRTILNAYNDFRPSACFSMRNMAHGYDNSGFYTRSCSTINTGAQFESYKAGDTITVRVEYQSENKGLTKLTFKKNGKSTGCLSEALGAGRLATVFGDGSGVCKWHLAVTLDNEGDQIEMQ